MPIYSTGEKARTTAKSLGWILTSELCGKVVFRSVKVYFGAIDFCHLNVYNSVTLHFFMTEMAINFSSKWSQIFWCGERIDFVAYFGSKKLFQWAMHANMKSYNSWLINHSSAARLVGFVTTGKILAQIAPLLFYIQLLNTSGAGCSWPVQPKRRISQI